MNSQFRKFPSIGKEKIHKSTEAGVSSALQVITGFQPPPQEKVGVISVSPSSLISHSQLTFPAMVSLLMKSAKSTVGVQGSFWLKTLELLGSVSFLWVTASWYLEMLWSGVHGHCPCPAA